MRRGDVYLVNLDPVVGSEANKTRPAIIVSNDDANASVERHGRGVVTVVPVTGNTARIYHSFQVELRAGLGGLDNDSKAQCEQVRAVDARRLVQRLGAIPSPVMASVNAKLRLHLDL